MASKAKNVAPLIFLDLRFLNFWRCSNANLKINTLDAQNTWNFKTAVKSTNYTNKFILERKMEPANRNRNSNLRISYKSIHLFTQWTKPRI